MDAALGQLREDHPELAVAHERLAADDRDVQGAVSIHDRHELVDQLLALEVAHFAQRHAAA